MGVIVGGRNSTKSVMFSFSLAERTVFSLYHSLSFHIYENNCIYMSHKEQK